MEGEIGKGRYEHAHSNGTASEEGQTIHYNPKTKKAHVETEGGGEGTYHKVDSIHHAIRAFNYADKHGVEDEEALKKTRDTKK